jgi:AcrR family transcriptional regulator
VARGNSGRSRRNPDDTGELIRELVVDRVTEKLNKKAEKYAEKMEGLGSVVDFWLRTEPGRRQPRFSLDDIARAAVRIADAEGIDALSMRRLALDLGAGTMTLYHYVRTKDELLSLLTDHIMGEIVLPASKLRGGWRSAITAVAHSSRAAFERHPWIFDIVEDPAVGPNGVRHFDQSLEAVSTLPGTLADKLDVIHAVDEYVFGYCLHARNDQETYYNDDDPMRAFMTRLISTGQYPSLSALVDEYGMDELWSRVDKHSRDARRFDRNLARLLDGFEASLRK